MKFLTDSKMPPLDVVAFTQEQPSNTKIDMIQDARDVLNEKMSRIKYHALRTKGYKATDFNRN